MKEEVNLGSRHRNQDTEKARSRSDQPSEDGTALTRGIMTPVAETKLLNTDSSRRHCANVARQSRHGLSAQKLRSVITAFAIKT